MKKGDDMYRRHIISRVKQGKQLLLTIITSLFLCTVFVSCDNWLDVEPKTNIDESELFSTEQGFKEILTGIYIQMASQTLYGREMTYGFMDQLAQRYYNPQNKNANYSEDVWYTYPSTKTQSYTDSFWKNIYNLIANLNNLLVNIDAHGDVITTTNYRDIIKGEALGLRSFLYFDLLRMFGPIYKDNPSSPSVPYRTVFGKDVVKLMPANELVEHIIADLKEAEALLANDPMRISFPASGVGDTDFMSNRFNRMNKYAVKAELARVYQWKGDAVQAAHYAEEVINGKNGSGNNLFKLVTDNAQDRLGSTELVFALNMDSETFSDIVESDFELALWSYYVILDPNRLYQIFDTSTDGMNDSRLREGAAFSITPNGAVTQKYMQNNLKSEVLKNTMPLIRLSEMYYILAECTTDLGAASDYLSEVRTARGLGDVTIQGENDRLNEIEKEYRKEFYAEGQLWYFYKRHGYSTFLNCPIQNMVEANYRFPIPDDETMLGNIN